LLAERQAELLTLLGVRRRTVHRDEIAAAMWPDAEAETAQGALRTLVSRLRSIPGLRDVIVTAGDGYALAATVVSPQRLRTSLEAFETNPAPHGDQRTEIVNAFDALLLRDRSRVTRWEWFADTERELELLQERAGYALMRETLPHDPRTALTIARTMIRNDDLDVTARSIAIQAQLALGNVAAAHREVSEFEALCREAGASGIEFSLRALLQSWQERESSAS
jgi:two-component SAPR family response regulator